MPAPHSPTLHGYRYSVYNRVARLTLEEKGVDYDTVEVDPFADPVPPDFLKMHPFGRVPTLRHGDFTIYETAAIARYVDAAFPGPPLTPTAPRALGRVAQVVSIVDSYGYWPMVRQVAVQRVFNPLEGEPTDPDDLADGLQKSRKALAALDAIAAEGEALTLGAGGEVTLADLHLAPMIDYFVRAPEGAAALADHPALAGWWAAMAARPSMAATDPGLPAR